MELLTSYLHIFYEFGWLVLIIPFLILILCGLGLPLPEDILLVVLGFIVYNGFGNITVALILGYVGIITGDSIIYCIGKRYGLAILNIRLFSRIITERRLAKARKFAEDHGKKTVFLARFLPGLRAAIFFTCGTLKMRFLTFFLIDSLAAIISAPVFVLLGYFFGDKIDILIRYIRRVDNVVITILVCTIIALWILKKAYNRKSKLAAPDDTEEKI